MTSKRCFSRIMLEDFRHKIWMLALSILGNMLALPVAYLMRINSHSFSESVYYTYLSWMSNIVEFFSELAVGLGGVVAIVGAVIVGLAGFRYLFHKNMVDTWHSLPVKRTTLFIISWLNGFLIWFIPFIVGFLGTLGMAVFRMGRLKNEIASLTVITQEQMTALNAMASVSGLILAALKTILVLVIVFILVYNVVLLAVMFSGNVLNTIVLSGVFGVGIVIIYGMVQLFSNAYMDTYIAPGPEELQHVIYASPMVSAVYLLIQRVSNAGNMGMIWPVVINAVIGIGMGVAAGLVYRVRPSELSEQGVRARVVKWISQCMVSVAAALSGWFIFTVIARDFMGNNTETVWGVFGAILLGILGYGALNVIFHMDFKAFLKGKLMMVGCVVAGLFISFSFNGDWFGYDTYLPKKENIVEMGIFMPNVSTYNYYSEYYSKDHPLQNVHIKDADKVYAFLEVATERERDVKNGEEVTIEIMPDYFEEGLWTDSAIVKVTLKNGKEYYRRYGVRSDNYDAALALVTTPEYIAANYLIPEAEMTGFKEVDPWESWYPYDYREWSAEEIVTLCTAYNRDVAEHAETLIKGDGRNVGTFTLRGAGNRRISLYDNMENSIHALEEIGREDMVRFPTAEELAEIDFSLDFSDTDGSNDENRLVRFAADRYGVYPQGVRRQIEEEKKEAEGEMPGAETIDKPYYYQTYCLKITAPEEIKELLPLLDKCVVNGSAFQKETCYGIDLVDKNGRNYEVYIKKGTLPEKYILRFAEAECVSSYY